MQLISVRVVKPDDTNFILGQTHFIKSVEDIHEAVVAAVPGIKFGLAFCEASGKCLVRWSGTDPGMVEMAKKNATAIAAGHSFIVFLGDGCYPLNVLNTLRMVPEVCRIFCATANPTELVLAETEQGRGILGVVDGFSPKGVEERRVLDWIVSDLNLVLRTMIVMAEALGLEAQQVRTLVTTILNLAGRASYNTMTFMALESGLKPNQARTFLDACIRQMHEYPNLDIRADMFQGFSYTKAVYPRRR
jgi:adenosine/AMP kinase